MFFLQYMFIEIMGKQQGRNTSQKIYNTNFNYKLLKCISIWTGVSGLREEFKLLRDLLAEYDPAARPVMNLSEVVEVRMGVALFQIRELVCYQPMPSNHPA